nr:hypothetical protein [Anaerobacillus isosaccharinicus]
MKIYILVGLDHRYTSILGGCARSGGVIGYSLSDFSRVFNKDYTSDWCDNIPTPNWFPAGDIIPINDKSGIQSAV